MKQKLFLLALLCVGCTLVGYGQKKPSKPAATTPRTTATAPTRPTSSRPASAMGRVNDEELPDFERSGGKPMLDAFRERENSHSLQREETMEPQKLSQLLWMACGQTTPNNYTALQTSDMPCVEMYMINNNGIYRYEREIHQLTAIRKGKFANTLMGNEISVDAATAFFFVFQPGKASNEMGRAITETEAYIDCGAIMQNIALFCANEDMACIPIAFSDKNKTDLLKAINLPEAMVLYGIAIGRK
ncbi:MAG: nitroreductase family protein [Bacteroidales bacterium]|nr:nitroreductase family protein [Bacteroidales bacterium]MBP5396555.1 nitroreductase family protein [Bacteroidales bacterium]MBP5612931.1 nitroreductase family protein [Bacteroidales bacterium]